MPSITIDTTTEDFSTTLTEVTTTAATVLTSTIESDTTSVSFSTTLTDATSKVSTLTDVTETTSFQTTNRVTTQEFTSTERTPFTAATFSTDDTTTSDVTTTDVTDETTTHGASSTEGTVVTGLTISSTEMQSSSVTFITTTDDTTTGFQTTVTTDYTNPETISTTAHASTYVPTHTFDINTGAPQRQPDNAEVYVEIFVPLGVVVGFVIFVVLVRFLIRRRRRRQFDVELEMQGIFDDTNITMVSSSDSSSSRPIPSAPEHSFSEETRDDTRTRPQQEPESDDSSLFGDTPRQEQASSWEDPFDTTLTETVVKRPIATRKTKPETSPFAQPSFDKVHTSTPEKTTTPKQKITRKLKFDSTPREGRIRRISPISATKVPGTLDVSIDSEHTSSTRLSLPELATISERELSSSLSTMPELSVITEHSPSVQPVEPGSPSQEPTAETSLLHEDDSDCRIVFEQKRVHRSGKKY